VHELLGFGQDEVDLLNHTVEADAGRLAGETEAERVWDRVSAVWGRAKLAKTTTRASERQLAVSGKEVEKTKARTWKRKGR